MTTALTFSFRLATLCALSALSGLCLGGFNPYDARTVAMGNTSVAVANTDIAYFYNPSILAFHYEDEDKTRDGRILLPTMVAQYSPAVKSAFDLIDKKLDQRFNDAIDIHNEGPTQETAANAGSLARRVDRIVDKIKGEDVALNSYFGMGISEVGELAGGSFFIGTRAIGGGIVEITPEDEILFDQYIGALDYLAAGGEDCLNPDFIAVLDPDGDCTLADPDGRFTSIANFRGAVIVEAGVSLAKLYIWKDFMIAVGATPKIMGLQALDENRRFSEENFDIISDTKSHFFLNFDAGVTLDYKERYRVGLAVKDAVRQKLATSLDNKLYLGPSVRLGLSYLHPRFSVGADYDLNKAESFAGEAQRQDFSIGTEIKLFSLTHLRLGYRADTLGNYENLASVGFGFGWRYLFIESAYAKGKDQESVALQLGITF